VAVTVDSGVQSSPVGLVVMAGARRAVIGVHIWCVAVDHCRHVLGEG
jgi:hypothetical protein